MANAPLEQGGELQPGVWFSTLFVAALQGRFTGVVQLQDDRGDRALFFRDGDPVHAGGLGFQAHYLGQVLVEMDFLPEHLVREALERHQMIPEGERPLFGAFLVQSFGLSSTALDKALVRQCEARFEACFGLREGAQFQSTPGENEYIKSIAVNVDGWSLLLRGLRFSSPNTELHATADLLLGRSVRMKGSLRQLEALMTLPREVGVGLRYLDRPRRPDQLERALRRRPARALLRLLELLDLLETLPAGKAIPIPAATRARPGPETGKSDAGGFERTTPRFTESSTTQVPTPPIPTPAKRGARPSSRPRTDKQQSLFSEIDRFHAVLETGLDHFAVLGVQRDVTPEDLKKRQLELVRRFHPDKLPGGDRVPADIRNKAQAISSAVNAAYNLLEDPEARAEYEKALANGTIRGNSNRQDLIEEARIRTKKALHYIRDGKFQEARAELERALELDPKASGVRPYLAWAIYSGPRDGNPNLEREVLQLLEEAVKDEPENADVHYYLGRVLKEAGDLERALKFFRNASHLNSKYHSAASEMRILKSRIEKQQKTDRTNVRKVLSRFFRRG